MARTSTNIETPRTPHHSPITGRWYSTEAGRQAGEADAADRARREQEAVERARQPPAARLWHNWGIGTAWVPVVNGYAYRRTSCCRRTEAEALDLAQRIASAKTLEERAALVG